MKASVCLLFAALFLCPGPVFAQQTFPVPAPADPRDGCYAFTNATIFTDYKTRIEGATLVVRKGKIEACGPRAAVPADAVTMDCTGKTIYPAFIDCYAAGFGLPETKPPGGPRARDQQPLSTKKGAFAWNEALKPEFNAADHFVYDEKAAAEWLKNGFATVQTFRADGISRGTGALVSLSGEREHEAITTAQSAHFLSFRKGTSPQDYPSSLIGTIALLRQTYLDGQWHKAEGWKTEKNLSLDAWNAAQSLPQVFEASDKLDVLRIARLGQEFGVKFIVRTGGDDYQRLDALKFGLAEAPGFILGLNFPEAPEVRDPFAALEVSLKDLKHWELAPANPARVAAAGIPFALTPQGLKDKSSFLENLRKAIENGLSEEAALRALTFQPAGFLGQSQNLGSLEAGKTASFFICEGNVFEKNSRIVQTWAKGKAFIVKDLADIFPRGLLGEWALVREGDMLDRMVFASKRDDIEAHILRGETEKTKLNLSVENGLVSLSFQADTVSKKTTLMVGAISGNTMRGRGTTPEGRWFDWSATLEKPAPETSGPTKPAPPKTPEVGDVIFPFTGFGWREKPAARTVLIQNATVWTNEKEGTLKNTDVLVSGGKIVKIGPKLPVQDNALLVDGSGKHLTAGIIDEHSHIAVSRGINEGTQESSAEVRIGDALDSEDIDIYRQLAGGVTASHLLHGSSNPIGGQTQLIKMRWGLAPEELKFPGWPGFIKFALGENVKQGNSDSDRRSRYPQTRMGVEQTYVDYFTRARAYGEAKKSGRPFRKDLDLEALLEILESKRFITCHSYVQSEIVMMMRTAERFGFKLNTFTHILEGYKVADKMARHGAGAAGFADWWAYKWEVYQAIPHNAKMMADQGVLVAINSDDAEMARRLNQEAAKSVMYAGMKEEDAWKMVTLNPAKLLHVDERTGSLRPGKDADLVLWNEHPLSVYARAEKTWVDGVQYFDRQEDAQMQQWVERERARLVQKVLATQKGDGEPRGEGRPGRGPKRHYHCDDAEDEGN